MAKLDTYPAGGRLPQGRCIAVAQTCAVPGDVAANLDQHLRLARLATAGGANVVVFPELSLTGYELDQADALAFQRIDDRLEPLLSLARKASATIIAGAPVRLAGALYIGAAVMDADGGLEWYTKRHLGAFGPGAAGDALAGRLPPDERTIFAPGTHDPAVHLILGTARLGICADSGHPEHAAAAAATGAGAYLVGAFIVPSSWEAEAAVVPAGCHPRDAGGNGQPRRPDRRDGLAEPRVHSRAAASGMSAGSWSCNSSPRGPGWESRGRRRTPAGSR